LRIEFVHILHVINVLTKDVERDGLLNFCLNFEAIQVAPNQYTAYFFFDEATKCQNPNCNKYAGGNKVSAPKFCCTACKNSKGTRHGPRCTPYQIIKSGEGECSSFCCDRCRVTGGAFHSLKCTIFKNPRYVKVAEEKILGGTSAAIVIENGGENDEEAATAVPNKRPSDVQSILSNEEMNTAVAKVQGNRFCKESSVSSESSDSESDDFVIVKQSDFYVIVRPLPCTEC